MKLSVLKEEAEHERRVSATPETVSKLKRLGLDVLVETQAGLDSTISDEAYRNSGATIADRAEVVKAADIILGVQAPEPQSLEGIKPGTIVIAAMNALQDKDLITDYAKLNLIAMAMELMPRISRAQSMDILSSQSNLAGYKAVLDACEVYGSAIPMMMTAAGTIPAARIFVMGAGVAGLQAIATARRLGAIVSATDVRLAAKEQVESLGAKFVMVEDEEAKEAETSGGYAKEMSESYRKKQAELVAETIKKQNIVITTALIPGRPAPRLISKQMVQAMQPGSVVVDLASEQGGNCELTQVGEIVKTDNGVSIIGHYNVPSRLATDASSLFARNLYNFLAAFHDEEKETIVWDEEDEILQAITLTRNGNLIHPMLKE